MTDEKDKPDDETPEAKAEGPRGGERLAEARRAKQIGILEIAKELSPLGKRKPAFPSLDVVAKSFDSLENVIAARSEIVFVVGFEIPLV